MASKLPVGYKDEFPITPRKTEDTYMVSEKGNPAGPPYIRGSGETVEDIVAEGYRRTC